MQAQLTPLHWANRVAEPGVEILCVGTELLLGDILNGNARWIAEQLAGLGLPHYRQTVVGDNQDRLISAVREASQRCRVLVTVSYTHLTLPTSG